jgi:hypothetical protein
VFIGSVFGNWLDNTLLQNSEQKNRPPLAKARRCSSGHLELGMVDNAALALEEIEPETVPAPRF